MRFRITWGICFGNSESKIFACVLRLKEWLKMNDRLSERQSGFGEMNSTVDNIFSLVSVVRLMWDKGSDNY